MVLESSSAGGSSRAVADTGVEACHDCPESPDISLKFINTKSDRLSSTSLCDFPQDDDRNLECVTTGPDGGWGWVCTFSGFWIQFFHAGIFIRSFGLLYLAIGRAFPEAPDSVKAWIPGLLLSLTMTLGEFTF